jgi:tRNA modification GTPase
VIRLDTSDTIVAISSAPGLSLRSIVRLSGPQSWPIVLRLTDLTEAAKPTGPVSLRVSTNPNETGLPIAGRLQFWPSGRSFTGDELVELHLDVPNVLAEEVVRSCSRLGARSAEPGEFSLRAFLANRIDLTRAEAIAGIFQAVTPEQLETALDQLAGGLGRRIDRLRGRLLDLLAWLEATLDFVDEVDVDPVARNFVAEELRGAAWELDRIAGTQRDRDASNAVSRVMLVGPPNAGKSLLFNRLSPEAGRALVSPVAGTTRDYLEAVVSLGGDRRIVLVDTAGEGETEDAFDEHSRILGRRERRLADLFLICRPIDEPSMTPESILAALPTNVARLHVLTKADLVTEIAESSTSGDVVVSAETGFGLELLRHRIRELLDAADAERSTAVSGTRRRAGDALLAAIAFLRHAGDTVVAGGSDEFVAMDLRGAVEALDVVTGLDATEEVLDRVFSRFCIGK